MDLPTWIAESGMTRSEFARRVGVTPGVISDLCNGRQRWINRPLAAAIARETEGRVTANDFVGSPEAA